MKRTYAIVISVMVLLVWAGCSSEPETKKNQDKEQAAEETKDQDGKENDAAESDRPEKVDKLIKKDLKEGTGKKVEQEDQVSVHYTGWLFDASRKDRKGKKFDSSHEDGKPLKFKLGTGQVIEGWEYGLYGMKEGGVRRLYIPADKAYGDEGVNDVIPPGADLIFEVKLVDVDK